MPFAKSICYTVNLFTMLKRFDFYFTGSHLKCSKHLVIFLQSVQCLSGTVVLEFLCFPSEESSCSFFAFCHWAVVFLVTFGFLHCCCDCLKPKSNHLYVRIGSPRHHTF